MQRQMSEGDTTAMADTRECDQQAAAVPAAAAEALTTTAINEGQDGAAVRGPVSGPSPGPTPSRLGGSCAEGRPGEAQPPPNAPPAPYAKVCCGPGRKLGEGVGQPAAGSRSGGGEPQESKEIERPQPTQPACGKAPSCDCAGGLQGIYIKDLLMNPPWQRHSSATSRKRR